MKLACPSHGGTIMKQDARRNLHRRKRRAIRLARKTYFKALKQPVDAAAAADKREGVSPSRS
jgi:hypothetical protein